MRLSLDLILICCEMQGNTPLYYSGHLAAIPAIAIENLAGAGSAIIHAFCNGES